MISLGLLADIAKQLSGLLREFRHEAEGQCFGIFIVVADELGEHVADGLLLGVLQRLDISCQVILLGSVFPPEHVILGPFHRYFFLHCLLGVSYRSFYLLWPLLLVLGHGLVDRATGHDQR